MAGECWTHFPRLRAARSVTSMKILIVGAQGQLGRAVDALMRERGHEVVTVGRSSGDIRCDIADEAQLARLWERVSDLCVASRMPPPKQMKFFRVSVLPLSSSQYDMSNILFYFS